MADFFLEFWPWLTSAILLAVELYAAGHVILFKRDHRAALGWLGLILFVPVFGVLLYVFFGINRVQRRARRMRRRNPQEYASTISSSEHAAGSEGLDGLSRLIGQVTGRVVTPGNQIQVLDAGQDAYDAMLAAIHSARKSIALCTYIFDNDRAGQLFKDALAAAVKRGVAVRVLIDDVGSRYSFPSIVGRLRAAGVTTARFMPSLLPWRFAYAQLRNHRKILVVDGISGFTGGMNIREGHDARLASKSPIRDCHFQVDGPIVADLRAVFADDWFFTTKERLNGETWFPPLEHRGNIPARGIISGPDDHVETLRSVFLGAVACARESIRIVSPYFLPDLDLASILGVAAMRGVRVEILIPEVNNLFLVQWAMMAQLGPLLEKGCRIWRTPPPFDHSKLLVVDGRWALIGTANWDSRSQRLNFEFNLECDDAQFARRIDELIDGKRAGSRPLTLSELRQRGLARRLRDGIARLASPYL